MNPSSFSMQRSLIAVNCSVPAMSRISSSTGIPLKNLRCCSYVGKDVHCNHILLVNIYCTIDHYFVKAKIPLSKFHSHVITAY